MNHAGYLHAYEQAKTIKVAAARLSKHGITEYQFTKIFALQKGLCGCCSEQLLDDPEGMAIDHDHASGQVRGLLCRDCNTLLGRLGDTVDKAEKTLARIQRYLTAKRTAVSAILFVSDETERAMTQFEQTRKTYPTWMSRCASLLGFGFAFNGVEIDHYEELYGCYGHGTRLGQHMRKSVFVAAHAVETHSIESGQPELSAGKTWDRAKVNFHRLYNL